MDFFSQYIIRDTPLTVRLRFNLLYKRAECNSIVMLIFFFFLAKKAARINMLNRASIGFALEQGSPAYFVLGVLISITLGLSSLGRESAVNKSFVNMSTVRCKAAVSVCQPKSTLAYFTKQMLAISVYLLLSVCGSMMRFPLPTCCINNKLAACQTIFSS